MAVPALLKYESGDWNDMDNAGLVSPQVQQQAVVVANNKKKKRKIHESEIKNKKRILMVVVITYILSMIKMIMILCKTGKENN